MLTCLDQISLKPQIVTSDNAAILKNSVWIDMLSPTKSEEELIEHYLNCDIPTRAEMVEIELSSRLYRDNGNYVMTANMIAQSDTIDPIVDPVTFILTKEQLITIRYIEPQAFKLFGFQMTKLAVGNRDALTLFLALLDATVDRLADILELVGHRLEAYSKSIFRPETDAHKPDYLQLMRHIGAIGELNSKVSESLISFSRLITFFSKTADVRLNKEMHLRLTSMNTDLIALSDHVVFFSSKITFLLEATLGLVNIDQNNIIKSFSVAAVIFLPPTLIVSFYGMNFQHIPELSWKHGYIFVLGLILVSAWLPYKFFKYKKWL